MKTCNKCEESLPLTAFYKHPRGLHGVGTTCKECVKLYDKARRDKDPEAARKRERDRYRNDPQRRDQQRRQSKAWREAHPEEHASHIREWTRRNPEKRRAHSAVARALRSGKLTKGPCEVAGCSDTRVHAHHDDYAKPLDVRWLCSKHHGETRLKCS